jgi:hypothetical protein
MALTFPNNPNITLGAGRIFFAVESSSTTEGSAWSLIGETPGFEIGGASEILTVDSSDTPVAEELVRIVKKVSRESTMTIRDIKPENLALFLMGTATGVTQATGTANTTISMTKGKYYKVGGDDVMDITVVTGSGVKQGTASGAAIPRTTTGGGINWELDNDNAIIYLPTGSAATTGNIYIAYSKVATTWDKVSTGTSPVFGSLLFIADNTVGENYRLKISRCQLSPNGNAAFKSRDNPMELSLSINILTRDSNTPQVEMWSAPA